MILGIVIPHHNVQNQQKIMHLDQENGLKPHLGCYLAVNGPFWGQHNFFFQKSKRVAFLDLFQAILMQKIRKN